MQTNGAAEARDDHREVGVVFERWLKASIGQISDQSDEHDQLRYVEHRGDINVALELLRSELELPDVCFEQAQVGQRVAVRRELDEHFRILVLFHQPLQHFRLVDVFHLLMELFLFLLVLIGLLDNNIFC